MRSIGETGIGIGGGADAGWAAARFAGGAVARGAGTGGASDFEQVLGRSVSRGVGAEASAEDKARRAAEKLVAVALIQPVLKQLRETNQATGPFAPTQGEKQFQSLADTQTAERIAAAANFPLVDRIAQQVLSKVSAAGAGAGAAAGGER